MSKKQPTVQGSSNVAIVVMSDKLLLTMLTGNPQLQDLNPDSLQAASLQIFGLKLEQYWTLENPLKLMN
ncbi:hypothetical protein DSO57_1024906 [Entomophthora muscae]|uniref:Uncharacterized protein n=1 Tax=Entomophthora muscae TaxID=34485 RepID=A0ACC2T2C6_9FUNG|nr:hypothetical protein DSO57_1024906 [Entomophthora muscae]